MAARPDLILPVSRLCLPVLLLDEWHQSQSREQTKWVSGDAVIGTHRATMWRGHGPWKMLHLSERTERSVQEFAQFKPPGKPWPTQMCLWLFVYLFIYIFLQNKDNHIKSCFPWLVHFLSTFDSRCIRNSILLWFQEKLGSKTRSSPPQLCVLRLASYALWGPVSRNARWR